VSELLLLLLRYDDKSIFGVRGAYGGGADDHVERRDGTGGSFVRP
jgi:hypothetical protein